MFPQHFYTWMLWSNVAAIHDFPFTIAFLKWWVRLSVKAILQQYLANTYQDERNSNFKIIFLCWLFWWLQYCKNICTIYNNTKKMLPFRHWLSEQYCLNVSLKFRYMPLKGKFSNVVGKLRQYYSNNQWPNGNILPMFIYVVQIFLQYYKIVRKISIKI